MIPSSLRLPKNRIGFLLRKGKKLANEYLVLKYQTGGVGKTKNRFAVTISLKVDAKAVKRNLLRRQIYEIIRLNQSLIKKPSDMIFIGKPALAGLTYEKILESIIPLFKKIT
jgi:ribonuclease P protein component